MPINISGNTLNTIGAKILNSTNVILSGLTWYYDAGIADSYGGSGTNISNFEGTTANDATLSGFTFVTTYGGAFENTTSGTGSKGIQIPLTNFSKTIGTCEFWVRPTSYSTSNGMFVNRDSDTYNSSNWWWAGTWDSGSYLYFRLGNSSGCCGNDNSISSWSTTHPINNWGHYAFTWNSGVESKIYFNSVLKQTVSITSIPNSNDTSTGRWGLGHGSTNSMWLGQMASFKHYNRVLSASEVLQNYQADRIRFGK